MPCDAESPPETSADLLPMYTHDADGWWWGTSYAAPVTRITVYKEGVVGNVKNVYLTLPDSPVSKAELTRLANDILNLVKATYRGDT